MWRNLAVQDRFFPGKEACDSSVSCLHPIARSCGHAMRWLSPHPRASEPSAAVNHLVHRSEPSLDASGIPRLPNKENWAVNGPVRIILVRSRSVVSGHYLSAAANPGISTPCYLFRPTPVRVHDCYIRRSKVRVGRRRRPSGGTWTFCEPGASARADAGSRAAWRRNDVRRRMGSMYV
jgi:hypothetical protein